MMELLKSFNTTFGLPWKDRKSSYQVRKILAHFFNLVFIIFG